MSIGSVHYRVMRNCASMKGGVSAWNNSAPSQRILMKFDILNIFRKSVEKIKVSLKPDKSKRHFI